METVIILSVLGIFFVGCWYVGNVSQRYWKQLETDPECVLPIERKWDWAIWGPFIQGGIKPNVLPSEARAVVDFRILPGDTVASVIEHVHATIDDRDVTVRQVGNEPSDPTPVSDSRAESFTALRKTIHQVFPDVVVAPGLVIGRTDSRRYVNVAENSYRFLPMRLGRKDLKRIHGTVHGPHIQRPTQ